jgi:16S rRNA (cytosine1402-N4)-methyltransferase
MHEAVLLKEAVDGLAIREDGFYIDGTFGRGGHSREILARLGDRGRLLAIDKDPEALKVGEAIKAQDSRFDIVQASFADIADILLERKLGKVDGILLDLGVSSPQLDQAERGFSFLRDGQLDMRMNPGSGQSAAQWLAVASEGDIARVLKEYGEERYAKRIAGAIVEIRSELAITTTTQLAKIIAEAHPAWERGKHPATKSFQAIRIFINRELDDLVLLLEQLLDILVVGGRVAIISFHSLEDRLVKRFIKKHVRGDELPARVPVMDSELNRRLKSVGKAVRASAEEIEHNVRSRSAILRVAEKIA